MHFKSSLLLCFFTIEFVQSLLEIRRNYELFEAEIGINIKNTDAELTKT